MVDRRMFPSGSGDATDAYAGNDAKTLRVRASIAQVNQAGGFELLPALPGIKWRVVDMVMISIGGAAGAATTVDVLATAAAASRKLLAVAIAALTQSAVVRAGAANATVLADGASFTANDPNTNVVISKTGASLTTSTFIDIFLTYVADLA